MSEKGQVVVVARANRKFARMIRIAAAYVGIQSVSLNAKTALRDVVWDRAVYKTVRQDAGGARAKDQYAPVTRIAA